MEDNKHELISQTYKTLLKMASVIQSGSGKSSLDAKGSLETAKTLLTLIKETRFEKARFEMPYVLVVGEMAAYIFAAEPGNETNEDTAVKKAINLVRTALNKESETWQRGMRPSSQKQTRGINREKE